MLLTEDPMIIASLPARAARILAAHYRRLADALELHANRIDQDARASERRRARFALSKQIWHLVENHSAAGMTFDGAVAAVARETGFEPDLIHDLHRRLGSARRKLEARRRNIEIVRLAGRGWHDAEIAHRVGLKHPKSVSRILRRMLESDRVTIVPSVGSLAATATPRRIDQSSGRTDWLPSVRTVTR